MADKEIKIRALLDSQSFDQQVNQLQQRLNNMTRMQATAQQTQNSYGGAGSGMSKLSKAFMGDFNQDSIKNLKEAFNINTQKMQHESREMQQKTRQIKELAKLEKDMTEGQKQRVKHLQDEVQLIKEKGRMMLDMNNRMAQQAQGMGSDLSGFKGVGGPPTPPGQPPGMMARMGGFAKGAFAAMGGGAGVAGAVVGGASMYADYLSYHQTRDRQMLGKLGEQTQNANVGFQTTMQNKGFMNAYEGPERKAAFGMAMGERSKRLAKDPWRAAANIGGSALSHGIAGGAAGFFAGGVGAIPGAIAGGIYGAGKAMLNPDTYKQIFDRDAYNADVNAETMKNFRGNLTAMKMNDPSKFAASEMFGQRMAGYGAQQNRLGMGDSDFFGSAKLDLPEFRKTAPRDMGKEVSQRGVKYRVGGESKGDYEDRLARDEEANQRISQRYGPAQQANQDRMGFMDRSRRDSSGKLAFSEERIGRNINEILGAGGTTDFVTNQMGASMAGEYQRAGMTGAGRQLGQISSAGAGGQTESQYKKFLTEVFTTAMDETELSQETLKGTEETRRLMGTVVGLYAATAGAEGAGAEFLKGVTGMGGAEIAGAMSSFERRSGESGESAGTRGALKWGFLNSGKGKEMFKGVDQDTLSALTSKSMKNLDEDDVNIKYAAQQQGISPKEMLDKVRSLQRSGESYSAQTEEAQGNFKAGYEKYLGDDKKDNAANRKAFLNTKEGIELGGKSSAAYYREREGSVAQENASAQGSTLFGTMGELDDKYKSKKKPGDLPPGITAQGAAEAEASKAADQESQMQILNEHLPELVRSAQENTAANLETRTHTFKTAEGVEALVTYIKEGGDLKNENVIKQMQDMYNVPADVSGNQTSTGSGKGK